MVKQDNYAWNCAVITGGAGGIGRALAEHFISKGKKVIIVGRTESNLKTTATELKVPYTVLDVSDIASIGPFVEKLYAEHPDVDCLVNNAGIQKSPSLSKVDHSSVVGILKDMDTELDTNVRGILHLTLQMLPYLQQKRGAIFNVSSGLAFVPYAKIPIYNATKAFIHSWTLSLRAQLLASRVTVVEIIPPVVESNLHRDNEDPLAYKRSNPLSLEAFIKEVAEELAAGKDEACTGFGGVVAQKYRDSYQGIFAVLNGEYLGQAAFDWEE